MVRPLKPRTERKDIQLAFQVDMATKRKLEELARKKDVPVSQIAREAINQYLENLEKAA